MKKNTKMKKLWIIALNFLIENATYPCKNSTLHHLPFALKNLV